MALKPETANALRETLSALEEDLRTAERAVALLINERDKVQAKLATASTRLAELRLRKQNITDDLS